jgi:hypothetical protein
MSLIIFDGKTSVAVMLMIKGKAVIIIIVLMIFAGIFILPLIYSLSAKLSETTKVDANILLVEGWLPPYALEMAKAEYSQNNYDYVVTTGLKSVSEYLIMARKGYLVFYPQKYQPIYDSIPAKHTIEVNAYSDLEGEHCAHFNLFINDSLIADFYADKTERKYMATWEGSLSNIDSVIVNFDNDRTGDFGDRNLRIKEIIIDRKIVIPYQFYSEYDVYTLDGKYRTKNDYYSIAEIARNELIAMGMDSSSVIAIPCKNTLFNRTLTSALAFRDYADTSDIKIRGINILTLGTHARRTKMIYDKIFKREYAIGIISVPYSEEHNSRRYKVLKTIRETLGIIYYYFVLLVY